MSRSVLASLLITRARRRADLESATARYPDSEVLDEINESVAAWYRLMVEVRGQDYWSNSTNLTTVADTATYALPATCLQVFLVALTDSAGVDTTLLPFAEADRSALRNANAGSLPELMRYRILGASTPVTASGGSVATDYIEFAPVPAVSALTIKVRYVPTPPTLAATTSTLEGIAGYEEYVVLDTASKLALKDGDYALAGILDGKRAEVERSIRAIAPRRDAANSQPWVDARSVARHTGTRWR